MTQKVDMLLEGRSQVSKYQQFASSLYSRVTSNMNTDHSTNPKIFSYFTLVCTITTQMVDIYLLGSNLLATYQPWDSKNVSYVDVGLV